MSRYGVPSGSGHGSSLNADGTPFQIAWSSDGKKQFAKVIVDPFTTLSAVKQSSLVFDRLAASLEAKPSPNADFLQFLTGLRYIYGEKAQRFWIASSLDGHDVELYSSLVGDTTKERTEALRDLMGLVGYRAPFSFSDFDLGPFSVSSNKGCLTVYLRPRSVHRIGSLLPSDSVYFFRAFAGQTVGERGLLLGIKFGRNGLEGVKVDLCAHCVTPRRVMALRAAVALGTNFVGRPLVLVPRARVSYWGASYDPKGLQRIHIYLVPALKSDKLRQLATAR